MYIEPCCIDSQLPQLLREGGVRFFQTSGDITVARFMQAVSSMVGNGYTMVLVMPEIDEATLATIRYYFTREWLATLLLATAKDQSEQVRTMLGSYGNSCQYCADPLILDGQLAFLSGPDTSGARDYVVLQGAMLGVKDFSLSLYVGTYVRKAMVGHGDTSWQESLAPVISKLFIKPLITARQQDALQWR